MIIYSTLAIISGFLIDYLIGDPQGWPHIIRVMGFIISKLEKAFYPLKNKRRSGVFLSISVLLICAVIPILLSFSYFISPWLYFAVETFFCWQLLAARSLKSESIKVYNALKKEDIKKARRELSMIVGRDTENLNESEIIRGTVETIAENASDGVIAPLFYIMIFGFVGGCLYKAVNTMDSMIGYKNEKYINFGWFAAKTDDILNLIPSRLCAVLMIISAFFCRLDYKNAYKIWRRDRFNHASPNSAQTESVIAGAFNVRLAGDAYYFGKLCKKPFIGDNNRGIKQDDILKSQHLMYLTAVSMLIIAIIVRCVIYAAI